MRKWFIVIMFFAVLFTHPEKAEASSVTLSNASSTDKLTLTKDYLEGIWGNQNGFVCEFHSGDFIGFPKKTSTYLETYNYEIGNKCIKLRQEGTYICKLSIKLINADCIQINGVKAYRAGSKKADTCQAKIQKAFLGTWFDCDLSRYLHDNRWQFTDDMVTRSYTVAWDDDQLEQLEHAYYIHDFQLCYSGDYNPYYIRYSKDELMLYYNRNEIHLLRMNSAKLKGFLKGDNIFTGNYIDKDSLYYGDELIEIRFIDDTKESIDLDDPEKIAMECKFYWDGHELTMTVGDVPYQVYLSGQQRTLVSGNKELVLVPESYCYVNEYKIIKKTLQKNGKVETRTYTYSPYDQDAVKYLKLSFKYANNVVLNENIYVETDFTPFYPTGTYGRVYSIGTRIDIEKAKLTLAYRPEYLQYQCESDLAIAYKEEYDGAVKILTSTVNTKTHTITANYCGKGYYQLIDRALVQGETHDPSLENFAGNLWAQSQDTGDIINLIDCKYLYSSGSHFKVTNASELATAVYYANTTNGSAVIELMNDIDLSSYEWAPIGWSSWYGLEIPFTGEIIGNHHKITGLQMHSTAYCVGFVGLAKDCIISDLMIEDAKILGMQTSGILAANVYYGDFKNCSVSGSVTGSIAGSMFGYEDGSLMDQCTANVIVNGTQFNYLSVTDCEKSQYVVENPINITINDQHVIQGTTTTPYPYMRWVVYLDGHHMESKEVEDTLEYICDTTKKGEYIVYLEALFDDYFLPVSNKISFTIE